MDTRIVCRMLVSQFAICDRRLKAKMKISGVDLLLLLYMGPRCVSAATGLLRGVGNVVVEEDFRRLQTVGSITDFDLVNAKTNLKITTLTPGQVIVVSAIPGMISPDLNIDAKSTGSVLSVVFTLNGVKVQTENAAPWAFCCNSGPDFFTCKSLINGTHTITATPFSGKDGMGTKGTTASVTFTIVGTLPTSPTKSPIAPTKNPVAPVAPTKSPVVAPTSSPVAIATPTKNPLTPTKSPVTSTKSPAAPPIPAPVPAPMAPTKAPAFGATAKWIVVQDKAPGVVPRHESCFKMMDTPGIGRRAYLVGGDGSKDLDIYNPFDRTWSKGKHVPIGLSHTQCVVAQGLLWMVAAWTSGGFPMEKPLRSTYVYNPVNNSWTTRKALPLDRCRRSAAVVVSADQKTIYVSHRTSGGHETGNFSTALPYLDAYDITTDTWAPLSNNTPNPRDHTGGALINGEICVVGGRNGAELGWPMVTATDCYNLDTKQWTVKDPIPVLLSGSS
jgi:hypothetical protein